MLNSSTSTSITTFDIDVFTDFSLLFSPFFVSNIFVLRGHIVPLQQSFHKKIKQRRNCLCFALAMASDSFQLRNSHSYRNLQRVELHPGTTASPEKSKNFLLVSAWNTTFFESRGKKQISEVPFLHCAAQLFGASLKATADRGTHRGTGTGINTVSERNKQKREVCRKNSRKPKGKWFMRDECTLHAHLHCSWKCTHTYNNIQQNNSMHRTEQFHVHTCKHRPEH